MSEPARVQYKFMIPAELKARLEDIAHDNRRSLSAEIIARLEQSFMLMNPVPDALLVDNGGLNAVARMFNMLDEMNKKIDKISKDGE